MLHLFKKTKPITVGLDISSTAVKLIELSRSDDRYRVESYAVAPLPEDAVVDKVIKDFDAISDAIRQVVKNSKTNLKDAAISVADSSVITKVVQMDSSLNDDEVEMQIAFEADKSIPYPLEEVSLDFEVLGPTTKNPAINDVLMVASRMENVQTRTEVVGAAGLAVQVVDVDSYAVERASQLIADQLPNNGVNQTIAVVDIGANVTNLTVLYNLTTIFTREEAFGGSQLTKQIQKHYGLNYAEAGLAKKQGNLPDDYNSEVLQSFKDTAVLQVRRALQFFSSASQNHQVAHIVLAGGTASIPGLADLIAQQLNIPTTIANPFEHMLISHKVDANALCADAPALLISCGLAMRSFDDEVTENDAN